MELWDWDDVRDNRWTRLSKFVQVLGIRTEGQDIDKHDEERVSWTEAIRNIRRLRNKLHMWVYTKMQPNGTRKSVGSSGQDIRRDAEGERDAKRPRDRCETLRAIVRPRGHAAEESNANQRALEDLGGSQDPEQIEWRQYYGMSQSGINFCRHFGFNARICFKEEVGN